MAKLIVTFERFQKYGMSSWTEFGWFRLRRVACSFEQDIDPWGSFMDGSFVSDFGSWRVLCYMESVLKAVQESPQAVRRN